MIRTMKAAVWGGLACVTVLAGAARAADAQTPPLPDAVRTAVQKMVSAQRSGDLEQYAATLASPVGPVFRLHADSATKVGDAKRLLIKAMTDRFGPNADADPFAFATDDTQLKATLQRLVDIRIDAAGPSGNNWKLNVTTTVRMKDGSTRSIPQGFIAIESGDDWKVQDLAIAGHLTAERKGAETNWAIYRAFNVIADDVRAGKYASWADTVRAAKAKYDEITDADAPPPDGRDEYLAAEKLYNAGEFTGSLALFKTSADKSFPHAACMAAIQYSAGLGTKADAAAAVEWFRKDVARHDATAENFRGPVVEEGDGVPADPAEGLRLLKLAADQDNSAALLNIGRAYLFGLGVAKDNSAGLDYYNKSAALGNEQAAYFVKWLGQSPGNRSFKDERQAAAFQQISLLRANALIAEQSGYRADGTYRAADARLAADLRGQADRLARENGLE